MHLRRNAFSLLVAVPFWATGALLACLAWELAAGDLVAHSGRRAARVAGAAAAVHLRAQVLRAGKGTVEVSVGAGLQYIKLQSENIRRCLKVSGLDFGEIWTGRIHKRSNDFGGRKHFMQKLEPLRSHL